MRIDRGVKTLELTAWHKTSRTRTMLSGGRNEETYSGCRSSAATRVTIVEVRAPASTPTIRTTAKMKKLLHPPIMTRRTHQVKQAVVVAATPPGKSIRIGIEGCKLNLKNSLRVPRLIQKIRLLSMKKLSID